MLGAMPILVGSLMTNNRLYIHILFVISYFVDILPKGIDEHHLTVSAYVGLYICLCQCKKYPLNFMTFYLKVDYLVYWLWLF